MASLLEAVVVVRISFLCVLLCGVTQARAEEAADSEILGTDPGWRVEDLQFRTSYLSQRGRGFQSQDGSSPGSEAMFVVQPAALLTLRQNANIVHDISLPIDAISAASPDAVDATTSASKNNIAGDFEIRSAIKLSDRDTLTTRFVAHAEEWIGGGTLGAGWRRSFADDNATLSVNGTFGYDVFDDRNRFGDYLGKTGRATSSISAAGSQLLSPTTVVDASYGLTYQRGTLRTGWNAVPIDDGTLADEVFPRGRSRHAFTAGLAQHIPQTRSTAKVRYRFYLDDFGLRAHTMDVAAYQYVVDWLYVRASYRFHDQDGVDFFTTALPAGLGDNTLRTADSDLAPLRAHEYSLQITTVRDRGPFRRWSLSGEVLRYERSNGLGISLFALGLGRTM